MFQIFPSTQTEQNLGHFKKLTATGSFMYFTAVQDNNPNTVNELEVGPLYDPELSDSQLEQIKKGGTTSGVVAYELDDESTPVELVAKDNFGQNEIDRQTFTLDGSSDQE